MKRWRQKTVGYVISAALLGGGLGLAYYWHFRAASPIELTASSTEQRTSQPAEIGDLPPSLGPPSSGSPSPGSPSPGSPSSAAESMANHGTEVASLSTPQLNAQRVSAQESLDPSQDGWTSELLAEQIKKKLRRIASAVGHTDQNLAIELAEVVTPGFECTQLRPDRLIEVFRDSALVVRRTIPSAGEPSIFEFRGPTGLANALEKISETTPAEIRVKVKVVGVVPSGSSVAAIALVTRSGRMVQGSIQQNSTWHSRWLRGADDTPLKLASIQVADYEEVEFEDPGGTLYSDCTEAVLRANRSYQEQLYYGADYWMQHLEGNVSPRLMEAHIGLAVGDVNGDGLDDVYVCQPGGLPNRLYVQNADGSVIDSTSEAGLDVLDLSYSALLVDLDNDGDQDLALLTRTAVLVFSNDGSGHFELQNRHVAALEYSLTAADYDADGDLDLYVCNYLRDADSGRFEFGTPVPYHNATNGGRNVLLRNEGDWTFTDATEESGLGAKNDRWSYAAAWEDYNNDGLIDLYVANDFGHNNLYRNEGGRFSDVTDQTNSVDANFGMSVSWGDYNRDGWMDLYVGNMFSAAGNRVTFQQRFLPDSSDETKALYQRLARGNTLLQNTGSRSDDSEPTFRDVSEQASVTMGRWAWGSLFVDINNDGWEDLLVNNGYLTQENSGDL